MVGTEDTRKSGWPSLYSEVALWVRWLQLGLGTISLHLELRISRQPPQLETRPEVTCPLPKDEVEKEGECLLHVDQRDASQGKVWLRVNQIFSNLE